MLESLHSVEFDKRRVLNITYGLLAILDEEPRTGKLCGSSTKRRFAFGADFQFSEKRGSTN